MSTADAANWICPVCSRSFHQAEIASHMVYHVRVLDETICELQDKLCLLGKGFEAQVGEFMRATKENLRRAVEAEGEALELRDRLEELGE